MQNKPDRPESKKKEQSRCSGIASVFQEQFSLCDEK